MEEMIGEGILNWQERLTKTASSMPPCCTMKMPHFHCQAPLILMKRLPKTKFRLNEMKASEKEKYEGLLKGDQLQKARAEHNLGNISMNNKEYQNAVKHYSNSLRMNAKNQQAKYNLSQAIRKLKEQQKQPQPKQQNQPQNQNQPKDPSQKEEEKWRRRLAGRNTSKNVEGFNETRSGYKT